MIEPIKPTEIVAARRGALPDQVIEAFNELISENFSGKSATIGQNQAIDRILKKMNVTANPATVITRQMVFDRNYLNVEEVFRAAGWKVEYDKPGYNETYFPTFTFRS